MKGLITYSSKTGNTKEIAMYVTNALEKDNYEIILSDVDNISEENDLEFILLGGWVDKGRLDNSTRNYLKIVPNIPLGVFVTLGADPHSDHGEKVKKEIEKLLIGKKSLGVYLCHGKVKNLENLEHLHQKGISEELKEKIIETSKNSRMASQEELNEIIEAIKNRIKDFY